jgi:hypothetical protein
MRKYAAGAIRAERPYGGSVFLLSARAGGGLARVTAATMSAGNARYVHTTRSTDQIPARRFQPLIASNSFVPGAADFAGYCQKHAVFSGNRTESPFTARAATVTLIVSYSSGRKLK